LHADEKKEFSENGNPNHENGDHAQPEGQVAAMPDQEMKIETEDEEESE